MCRLPSSQHDCHCHPAGGHTQSASYKYCSIDLFFCVCCDEKFSHVTTEQRKPFPAVLLIRRSVSDVYNSLLQCSAVSTGLNLLPLGKVCFCAPSHHFPPPPSPHTCANVIFIFVLFSSRLGRTTDFLFRKLLVACLSFMLILWLQSFRSPWQRASTPIRSSAFTFCMLVPGLWVRSDRNQRINLARL